MLKVLLAGAVAGGALFAAMTLSDALMMAFRMWLWLASYRPISFIQMLMINTSDRARQKSATCFSNIFSSGPLSTESNPSVSITLKLATF